MTGCRLGATFPRPCSAVDEGRAMHERSVPDAVWAWPRFALSVSPREKKEGQAREANTRDTRCSRRHSRP